MDYLGLPRTQFTLLSRAAEVFGPYNPESLL